jgi:putative hydrolase of HD superfamily
MFVNTLLLNEIFRGFHIQRWNDRLRPMDLIEIDKHSHKMLIAFILAKYEENSGKTINWNQIIQNGIFELLRRIVISDIKSPIYAQITQKPEVFEKLNQYVYNHLKAKLPTGILLDEFYKFLFNRNDCDDLSNRILSAAHIYASIWEFRIIENANPDNYQIDKIRKELDNRIVPFQDLIGIKKFETDFPIKHFVDLFGYLRFQYRWAQIPRVPKTSVLGHSLLVAIISYLFVRENSTNPNRLYNAFFGGLFHDLPEAVTRDIISPVKTSSKELDDLIKTIEIEMAESEIYPLLEKEWIEEIKYFTIDEFENKIYQDSPKIINDFDEFNTEFDSVEFKPYDGKTIRAADHLAAFLEVWHSCNAGIKTDEMSSAAHKIKEQYINKTYGNVEFRSIYEHFSSPC